MAKLIDPFGDEYEIQAQPSSAMRVIQDPFGDEYQVPESFSAPVFSEQRDYATGIKSDSIVQDAVSGWVTGSNALLKSVGALYGLATGDMNNWAYEQGQRGMEYGESLGSDRLKEQKQRRSEYIAQADGMLEQAGVALWETFKNPRLLMDLTVSSAPTMLAGGIAGRLVGKGAQALGARESIANGSAVAATIGSMSAAQGADVAGGMYDELQQLPDQVWQQNPEFKVLKERLGDEAAAKEQIAVDQARKVFALATGVSAVSQTLPGAAVFEKMLAGKGVNLSGNLAQRVGKTALAEGTQEVIEEGGGQVLSNAAVHEIDPSKELSEGVGEASGLAFAAGASLGGVAGVRTKPPIIDNRVKSVEENQNAVNDTLAQKQQQEAAQAEQVQAQASAPEQQPAASMDVPNEAYQPETGGVIQADMTGIDFDPETGEIYNTAAEEARNVGMDELQTQEYAQLKVDNAQKAKQYDDIANNPATDAQALEPDDYGDLNDFADARVFELGETLETLEPGAFEAVYQRASVEGTPTNDLINELEGLVNERSALGFKSTANISAEQFAKRGLNSESATKTNKTDNQETTVPSGSPAELGQNNDPFQSKTSSGNQTEVSSTQEAVSQPQQGEIDLAPIELQDKQPPISQSAEKQAAAEKELVDIQQRDAGDAKRHEEETKQQVEQAKRDVLTIRDDDVITSRGKPFSTEKQAKLYARQNGYESRDIVPVISNKGDDGFALRKVESKTPEQRNDEDLQALNERIDPQGSDVKPLVVKDELNEPAQEMPVNNVARQTQDYLALDYNLPNNTVAGGVSEIKRLIAEARQNKQRKSAVRFDVVDEKQAQRLKENTGLELLGYSHTIDSSGINHSLKQHGSDKKEQSRGQQAISAEDFEKIPDIVRHYDTLEYVGKDKQGNDVIRYKKAYNGTTYYSEAVRNKRKELVLKSLWKTPTREQMPHQKDDPSSNVQDRFGGNSPQVDTSIDAPQPTFKPTHELADGTPVKAVPDEDNVWVDKEGGEWVEDDVKPLLKKPVAQQGVLSETPAVSDRKKNKRQDQDDKATLKPEPAPKVKVKARSKIDIEQRLYESQQFETGDYKALDQITIKADAGDEVVSATADVWLNALDDRLHAMNELRGCL